ncbi:MULTISPECIES: DUF1569 domain-containing protein [unclassified Roseateles]|jgi:hypothetical protein|uniref:DUF1569 domain-containing protein n=1 Tax=unclassified Roseateles TaxID=2626991 RepID=UPI0006FA1226|nr:MULTISPECIES: DUF1569 domain-containing protein [unclassified Roseateles]KQW51625.1 hypothetical protein ASC81_03070 [Pelomonas sp. Root405]KRA77858.1 hypothetical protein ASD88_03070 [Pelomonas sp. Root662]
MDRRRALKTSAVLLAAAPLAACTGRLKTFTTWKQAQQAVLDLLFAPKVVQGNAWNLSQVMQHLAQSIEYSMQGYPALRGAWFRSSVGSAAFAMFNARGTMSHDLAEPIPGAPALDAAQTLRLSVQRLLDAMDAFAQFSGTLRPHFAYGELTKPQYERAHLMHLANHWTQFHAKTAVA